MVNSNKKPLQTRAVRRGWSN